MNNLGIVVTFDELMDFNLQHFHICIHNFIEMRVPKNSGKLYELFLKYEIRHESNRAEMSTPQQTAFHIYHFRNEGVDMILEGKSSMGIEVGV